MSVKTQDVIDILNTLALRASARNCWNFGMGDVITRMNTEAREGNMDVFRQKGKGMWGSVGYNSEIKLNVTEVADLDDYQEHISRSS